VIPIRRNQGEKQTILYQVEKIPKYKENIKEKMVKRKIIFQYKLKKEGIKKKDRNKKQ
jgi:hypothetical protein